MRRLFCLCALWLAPACTGVIAEPTLTYDPSPTVDAAGDQGPDAANPLDGGDTGHTDTGSDTGADTLADSAMDAGGDAVDVGPDADVVSPLSCPPEALLPITQESLRLTDWQLDASIRSLLPFELADGLLLVSTSTGANVFSTFPGSNEVLLNHQRDLIKVGETVALAVADNLTAVLPCDPAALGERECAEQFVAGFATQAFRRPATSAEIDQFMVLYDVVNTNAAEPLDYGLSIGALAQAVVLSPEFLYMVEVAVPSGTPGVLRLTDYALATRLSYLLWNLPPDEILLARAAAGELQDKGVLLEEAARLLDDARSEPAMERFMMEWFGVNDHLFTDHADAPLAQAWDQEFRRLAKDLIYNGGTVSQLLDNDTTWVNAPLADHYGVSPNPSSGVDDWHQVVLPAERRGGLMTTAQFAAASAHNASATSIIHRGKAVREKFLCGQLAPPDPSFLEQDPVLGPDATVREKMDARMGMVPCGGCHQLMDTIGIGMEDMDQDGLFRDEYPNGHLMDAAGEVQLGPVMPGGQTFNGVNELAMKIAHAEVFPQCASEHWMRYVAGRFDLGDPKTCTIERIVEAASADGGTIRAMLLAAIASDAFMYRVEEPQQ